jgi:hypothetical protein
MTQTPQWNFREMMKGEMNADPVHGEFFSTEALDSLAAALVREFIQNALDARQGVDPVRVRFVLGKTDADSTSPYVDGLRGHVQAKDSGVKKEVLPDADEPMSFLGIEDFGTRGLRGDPTHDDEDIGASAGHRNDFYYFWRNLGRSGKGEAERGRWGLGHTVFAAASRMNSFLGLTVRDDDGRKLLMGQSVLKIHRVDGKKYSPYGWFGLGGEQSFVLPVESPALTDHFCEDFMLDRSASPGLSVVIPFPDMTIDAGSIARAAISHHFYPILSSDLIVEVATEGMSEALTRDTLRERAKALFIGKEQQQLGNLLKVFDLVEWSLALKPDDHTYPNALPAGKPSWETVAFPDEKLKELRDAYEAQKQIGVRISLPIQEKKGQPQASRFAIFMQRDPEVARGEIYFVRQGITIVNPSAPRERSVRAVVVIENGALSKLLGDAENPAHTEWQERSEKFRDKYEYGVSCLRFVKNSVHGIAHILTAASEQRDKDLLKDLFYVTQTADEGVDGENGNTGTKRKTRRPPPIPGIPKPPRFVKIDRVAGGFKISAHPDAPAQKRSIDVRLGYAVRKGSPIKRYVPEDFALESSQFTFDSIDAVLTKEKNRLSIETQSKDFMVKVTGL